MQRIVLSASRRTDIPAFYMPWFMHRIERGEFEADHPFGRTAVPVAATVDKVHSIVFWSKNFRPFLEGGYGERLSKAGFGLFFNFTINSPDAVLEPHVPHLQERLDQLDELCGRFGPQAVHWRFDPVCFYKNAGGEVFTNLDHFEPIARQAAQCGIKVCITSFADLYRKVQRRLAASAVTLFDPPPAKKIEVLTRMAHQLSALKIALHVCCEKELLAALPACAGVRGASCIPNHRLAALYGGDISLCRDNGQRVSAGCGCRVSRDIGSYRMHPCRHNCLFCYANPQSHGPAAVSG